MRIEQQSKILREDVPEAPNWIEIILLGINTLIQTINTLTNKNIDDNNILCQIKVINLTTTPSYPIMDPIKFPNDMKVRANNCQILQCIDKSTNKGIATYNPGWNQEDTQIVIHQVLGLQASKSYTIRFRITP